MCTVVVIYTYGNIAVSETAIHSTKVLCAAFDGGVHAEFISARVIKLLYRSDNLRTTWGIRLLLLSGLLLVVFGIGGIGVAATELSIVLYMGKPAWNLPDALPNISWVGHFSILFFIGAYNVVIGITAVLLRYYAHRAGLLRLLAVAGLFMYVGFIVLSGYHEAYLRGGMWVFPLVLFSYSLYIAGATLRFGRHKGEVSACL